MSEATPPPPVPTDGQAPAEQTGAAHGAQPTRGIGNVPRSSTETGKFGRLFRGLPPLALTEDQINAIVATMTDPGDGGGGGWGGTPTANDSPLPAGWTYFGQFVDHDITFDPQSLLDQANDPDALENFRTPRYDLDSLYGLGPSANPWLYQIGDPDKLLIGANGPEFTVRDLSRNQEGRALIGDPRNDVHVFVSQLHLAFALFHNRVVDLVRADPSLVTGVPATPVGGWGGGAPVTGQPTFGQIVTLVRWHYQWVVLTEFLPLLVGPDTYGQLMKRDKKGRLVAEKLKLYSVRRKPWMPIEFAAAAYRFGHSLVRDSYILNGGLSPLPVFSPAGDGNPLGDLRGSRRLPVGWEIEWHRFFDGLPTSGAETQRTRAFDTKLSASLGQLPPLIDQMRRSLALLNLKRGVAVELPSGEEVAQAVAAKLGVDPATFLVETGLGHAAPLWFWFLKEAEVKASGQHLGPVAGRIVAEVLIGLAQNDKSSFLRARPEWRPTLASGTPGEFTMADLFTIAGVTL